MSPGDLISLKRSYISPGIEADKAVGIVVGIYKDGLGEDKFLALFSERSGDVSILLQSSEVALVFRVLRGASNV
jgi:hypothetical protein